MKQTVIPAIIASLFVLPGCASTFKPYAQNPFNPNAKITQPSPENTGKVSDSTAFRAGGLGLAVASRPVTGAIPHGAGVGIAAALLLGSGSPKPVNIAVHSNYLVTAMPLTEAADEDAAQIKMGSLIENAIAKALSSVYQTKIEEYEDSYAFGKKLRPRWIRVDGPYCENWSCQIVGPLPTANALQWEGEMVKKQVLGKEVYAYHRPFEQTIGFVKITKEYDKNGVLAGSRRFVEGMEVSGFDYPQFFRRVSENLPDWAYFRIAKKGIPPYTLNRGVQVEE